MEGYKQFKCETHLQAGIFNERSQLGMQKINSQTLDQASFSWTSIPIPFGSPSPDVDAWAWHEADENNTKKQKFEHLSTPEAVKFSHLQ